MPTSEQNATPRVALFGATGQAGRRVLARLVARGCDVRVLVRFADRLDPDLRFALASDAVFEGDARDADLVRQVLAGAHVAASALGMSNIAEPATDLSDALRTIVGTMPAAGMGRIVVVGSAAALPDPRGGYRADDGTLPPALRNVSAEHVRQHQVLREAPVAWTMFCPTFFASDLASGNARTAIDALPEGSSVTGLDDLADAIVAEVVEPRFVGHRVGIVSLPG